MHNGPSPSGTQTSFSVREARPSSRSMVSSSTATMRTTVMPLILLLLSSSPFQLATAQTLAPTHAPEEEEKSPGDAVLFPFFTLVIGTCVYYVLTRYAPWMPYTAVMFVLGTIIGVCTVRIDNYNLLQESIVVYWANIDSEVLLLVFLPGLVANDAIRLDVHLFQAAFWQCFMFAFPMVLAGTTLTALVGFYIFPYNWSFNFAMMFGSILSATDPVAVSALLEQVGAPPRLRIHISGESLLNDGSAIVFYTIFSQLFLLELGLEGYGTDIDVGQGFALFFRMSLGAVASGLFFGFGTCLLVGFLDRRLVRQENVVETATILTMAYICYFVSDVVWRLSGVIATLTYGLIVNAVGRTLMNDIKLMEDFWDLVEHLLNTVLFTLGGLVWGSIIANDPSTPQASFSATDWGYLFLLYVVLMAIRFFLFAGFYPVTWFLGLSTIVRETVFQSFAGLRGAVGISLAIAIDNTVRQAGSLEFAVETNRLFGMIGGIAFLTLLINATLAGPMLRKLGLADATETRVKVLKIVEKKVRRRMIDRMVELLAEHRFHRVNFAVIRHHVESIADLTPLELGQAVRRYQRQHGKRKRFRMASLANILPYLGEDKADSEVDVAEINQILAALEDTPDKDTSSTLPSLDEGVEKPIPTGDGPSLLEIRRLYLEILRGSYAQQIRSGELVGREFLAYALLESVDHATDSVSKGDPINDWAYTEVVSKPFVRAVHDFTHIKWVRSLIECVRGPQTKLDVMYMNMRYDVDRCMAFLAAHRHCREVFHDAYDWTGDVGEDVSKVMEEVKAEVAVAEALLASFPTRDVEVIVSHKFCTILLNTAARIVEQLVEARMVTETEAEELAHVIQAELAAVDSCDAIDHPGELPMEEHSGYEEEEESGVEKEQATGDAEANGSTDE